MTTQQPKPIRSPSYPNMPLQEAVEAVAKIEAKYRSSVVDRADGAKLLGYSSLSGPSNMALAALAAYGLIERAGKGEMRVTERAKSILHPENDAEKKAALRAAALEPQLYRDLTERYQDVPIPPEDGVITYLNRQGFNPSAVRSAARAFLQTMQFVEEVGASESNGPTPPAQSKSSPPTSDDKGAVFGGASVGDHIQWESNGVLRLERPMRVRHVTPDGKWVAVEGSETGMPMEQVIVIEKGGTQSGGAASMSIPFDPKDEGRSDVRPRREVFALPEGDVTLTFPENLSPGSYEDLESYFQIFLRKAKRRIEADRRQRAMDGAGPDC